MVSPVVDEVATDMADVITVAKCNVDENEELALKYGVMSIPTLIIFRDGTEVGRLVGCRQRKACRGDQAHDLMCAASRLRPHVLCFENRGAPAGAPISLQRLRYTVRGRSGL